MNCGEVKKYIDAWERGESVGPEIAAGIDDHSAHCEDCRRSFAALLPLVSGDLRISPRPPVPDIASRVMERIYTGRFSEKALRAAGRRGSRILLPAAALAAVLAAAVFLPVFLGRDAEEVAVRFVLDLPEARSVSLVGDFTEWKSDRYRLSRKNEDGRWEVRVRLRKNRVYTYNFVIDGEEWIPDPLAPYRVEDGFGGENSLLQL